jgi:type III secretion protein N (ATPase)
MTRGRIIPGEIVDAEAAARAIRAQAAADADALLAAARHQVEVASDRAGAGAPPERAAAGDVRDVVGLLVRAQIPDATLGEVVTLERAGRSPLPAEVVGFQGELATLLPLGDIAGLAPRAPVRRTGRPLEVTCGEALLGRVLDGLGAPIDGGPPLVGEAWAVDRAAPAPLQRPRATAPLATGVRVVDGLCPLAAGQRVGLFASPGVGKSTLLGQLARGADADVIVTCQVGERGRELGELLATHLAPRRARTIAVCATSDAPSLVRARALATATAIAEWFRDRRGHRVLLLVDSLTRVARAQREVGLAAGEPPARHGYPPSVFALLPRLIERAGATAAGSITAIYTVLVAGGDLDEPIADEARGLLDAHLVLDRGLAEHGHYPPIDVVASLSRLARDVTSPAHQAAAAVVRERLAVYQAHRDLITLGAYARGSDRRIDAAIAARPAIDAFTRQAADEVAAWDTTVAALAALAARASSPAQ